MQGGTQSTADLIKGTAKGILVTRLYYIRAVDPQTLLYTGLTRDGTFYIGKEKYYLGRSIFFFAGSTLSLEAESKKILDAYGAASPNSTMPYDAYFKQWKSAFDAHCAHRRH